MLRKGNWIRGAFLMLNITQRLRRQTGQALEEVAAGFA